jgi:hypothetical protein
LLRLKHLIRVDGGLALPGGWSRSAQSRRFPRERRVAARLADRRVDLRVSSRFAVVSNHMEDDLNPYASHRVNVFNGDPSAQSIASRSVRNRGFRSVSPLAGI